MKRVLPFLTSPPLPHHPLVCHLAWKALMRDWILRPGCDFTPHNRLLPISPALTLLFCKRSKEATLVWRSGICVYRFLGMEMDILNFQTIQFHFSILQNVQYVHKSVENGAKIWASWYLITKKCTFQPIWPLTLYSKLCQSLINITFKWPFCVFLLREIYK